MFHINSICSRLLKCNIVLTVSCILSIMIGTVLILAMFNLASSAEQIYEKDMKALYGECDAAVFYGEYEEISSSIISRIVSVAGVAEYATLFYSGDVDVDGSTVYAIGTDNSEMVRSRYHFKSELNPGEVAINQVFAKSRGYHLGDMISGGDQQLIIKEIFDDETLSASSVEMLIADKKSLQAIYGQARDTNIILLKIPKISNGHLASELGKIDPELRVILFGTDEEYLKSVNSFKVFLRIVSICVLVVTALFTTTVFRGFLYKYRRDVAVLRMAGATPEQVKAIFGRMIFEMATIATVLGYATAGLIDHFLIGFINQKYHLVDGAITFQYGKSFVIAFFMFVLAFGFLNISILKINHILPIEALSQNVRDASGKISKNRRLRFLLGGNDFFISRRFIQSRLKDNRRMIATVAMLVALGIIGNNMSAAIKNNGEKYYKQYYLSEFVVTVSQAMSFEEGERFSQEFRSKADATMAELYQASFPLHSYGEEVTYGIADLKGFSELSLIERLVGDEKTVVLSKDFALKKGLQVGDTIVLRSPEVHAKDENGIPLEQLIRESRDFDFKIGAIAETDIMQGNDMLLDVGEEAFVNESVWLTRVYVNGEKNSIQNALNDLKNTYSTIKWASFSDAISVNEQKINSRFAVLSLVIHVLLLVAAIGWIHSLQSILVSRERDYLILRMEGLKRHRILRIMLYQILIYLVAGVLGGILLGITVIECTLYVLQRSFLWKLELSAVWQMLCVLLVFCMILIPTMIRINQKKLTSFNPT